MAASSIGLMNESFFVGRGELLAWINGLLSLQLTKVEAVRCAPTRPLRPCKRRARPHASLGRPPACSQRAGRAAWRVDRICAPRRGQLSFAAVGKRAQPPRAPRALTRLSARPAAGVRRGALPDHGRYPPGRGADAQGAQMPWATLSRCGSP